MLSKAAAAILSALIAASPASAGQRAAQPLGAKAAAAPAAGLAVLRLPGLGLPAAPELALPPAVPNAAENVLRAMADPRAEPEGAGLRFDGSEDGAAPGPFQAPSAPIVVPQTPSPRDPGLDPPDPRQPKKGGFLKRLNAASGPSSRAEARFNWAATLGIVAAVVIPIALKMEPAESVVVSLRLALTTLVPLFGAVTLYRAGRFLVTRRDPVKRPSRRRALVLATALGLLVGGGLATVPRAFERPFAEFKLNSWEGADSRGVRGDALPEAVVGELSKNPVGREVLDRLRDRFGALHLPGVYVSRIKEQSSDYITAAQYSYPLDALVINAQVLEDQGWTVESFLNDPALQREFARRFAHTFLHELTHAAQARGALINKTSFESEYQAYMAEHYWLAAKLASGPEPLSRRELFSLLVPLEVGLPGYFKALESLNPGNVHARGKAYDAWIAGVAAGWPAHSAKVYRMLAERAQAAGQKHLAARYRQSAAAAAVSPAPRMR